MKSLLFRFITVPNRPILTSQILIVFAFLFEGIVELIWPIHIGFTGLYLDTTVYLILVLPVLMFIQFFLKFESESLGWKISSVNGIVYYPVFVLALFSFLFFVYRAMPSSRFEEVIQIKQPEYVSDIRFRRIRIMRIHKILSFDIKKGFRSKVFEAYENCHGKYR